ncbi:predicted protein [Nematostella vectensis]|uniref:Polycystin cation channel PKD1/PKD2 domain-containing protein n=1 Tax=Nematostella vectensis TaxID=45351 RepID=A7RKQ4_NEMVE|nr:predicted protein [Nematostella vectensis]|eukprot:XP_001640090.1 predicted protein [Nematostella vectensis]
MIVAPNPIDFNKVFLEMSRLGESGNVAVLATIVSILTGYLVIIVIVRKADRNDLRKDILVVQPIKIILVAVVVAYLMDKKGKMKRTGKEKSDVEDKEEMDEEKSHSILAHLEKVKKNPYANVWFQKAVHWAEAQTTAFALALFATTLKFLRLLRYNKHIYVLNCTFRAAKKDLVSFSIVIFVIIIAFAQFAFIVLGKNLEAFSSLPNSLYTEFLMSLGGSMAIHDLTNTNRILGPIFGFGFVTSMAFLFVNMFVAILNDAYYEGCEITQKNNEVIQMNMVNFFMKKFERMVKKRDTKIGDVWRQHGDRDDEDDEDGINDSQKSLKGTPKDEEQQETFSSIEMGLSCAPKNEEKENSYEQDKPSNDRKVQQNSSYKKRLDDISGKELQNSKNKEGLAQPSPTKEKSNLSMKLRTSSGEKKSDRYVTFDIAGDDTNEEVKSEEVKAKTLPASAVENTKKAMSEFMISRPKVKRGHRRKMVEVRTQDGKALLVKRGQEGKYFKSSMKKKSRARPTAEVKELDMEPNIRFIEEKFHALSESIESVLTDNEAESKALIRFMLRNILTKMAAENATTSNEEGSNDEILVPSPSTPISTLIMPDDLDEILVPSPNTPISTLIMPDDLDEILVPSPNTPISTLIMPDDLDEILVPSPNTPISTLIMPDDLAEELANAIDYPEAVDTNVEIKENEAFFEKIETPDDFLSSSESESEEDESFFDSEDQLKVHESFDKRTMKSPDFPFEWNAATSKPPHHDIEFSEQKWLSVLPRYRRRKGETVDAKGSEI